MDDHRLRAGRQLKTEHVAHVEDTEVEDALVTSKLTDDEEPKRRGGSWCVRHSSHPLGGNLSGP